MTGKARLALPLLLLFALFMAAQLIGSGSPLGLFGKASSPPPSDLGTLEVRLEVQGLRPPPGLSPSLLAQAANITAQAYISRPGGFNVPLPFLLTSQRPLRLLLPSGSYSLFVDGGENFSISIPKLSVEQGRVTRALIFVRPMLIPFAALDVEDLNGDGCIGPGEKVVASVDWAGANFDELGAGRPARLLWPPQGSAPIMLRQEGLAPAQAPPQNASGAQATSSFRLMALVPPSCLPIALFQALHAYLLLYRARYDIAEVGA